MKTNLGKVGIIDELKEEIIDMKLGEKAMKDIRNGKGVAMKVHDFFKEMEEWVKE